MVVGRYIYKRKNIKETLMRIKVMKPLKRRKKEFKKANRKVIKMNYDITSYKIINV